MFYDERINSECGRIYKRGILLATLLTLIYGLSRLYYVISLNKFNTVHFLMEICVVGTGAVLLILGEILYGRCIDERAVASRDGYYLRAGRIFLFSVLGGYALSMPFSLHKSFTDYPANELIYALEILGVIYLFYAFKSRGISFNYSFIDEQRKKYFLEVMKNVGRLAVLLLPFYIFSAFAEALIFDSLSGSVSILLGYVFSVVGLGAWYFLISLTEKLSYDSKSGKIFDTGLLILSILAVLVFLADRISYVIYYHYVLGYFGSISNVTDKLNMLNEQRQALSRCFCILAPMALSSLAERLSFSRRVKKATRGILVVRAATVGTGIVKSYLFLANLLSAETLAVINKVYLYLGYSMFLVEAAFFAVLIFAVIKERGISRGAISAPIIAFISNIIIAYDILPSDFLRIGVILESALASLSVLLCFVFLAIEKEKTGLTDIDKSDSF